jgi:cytochrome d ubiquinol oxidase subunit I
MELDALLLSRIQFAFVVAFHILFPAFTIGLAAFLAVCEGLWLKTGHDVFKRLYLHWVKIFALAFAMGVVSGVVMSYQFGTNWSVFADKTGSVMGPLLGYEVLTAFFLEATFLGVMLFGWNRVGRTLHFVATCAVAIGTSLSAFWILAANSWMQTPAGFALDPETGTFYATDWIAVIFNPSFPSRYVHMMLAAFITTAAVILAAGAWQMLRGRSSQPTRWQTRMAVGTLAVLMPLQIWAGHWSGDVAHEHQPAKIAVLEGWCESKDIQGTVLLAWPADNECGHDVIEIPNTSPILFANAHGPEAAILDRLLELPIHGWRGSHSAGPRVLGCLEVVARHDRHTRSFPLACRPIGLAGLYRGSHRLDYSRSRPSALDGLRSFDYGGKRSAGFYRTGGNVFAGLHGGLRDRLHGRGRLHGADRNPRLRGRWNRSANG